MGINRNELRTGNKLKIGDIVVTVDEICSDGLETPEEGFLSYSHPQLLGLPITEEWLLKFGFEFWKGSNAFCLQINATVILSFDIDGLVIFSECSSDNYYSTSFNPNIKYVHELQNLYFTLTKTELVTP
jgi:hypothetical protein